MSFCESIAITAVVGFSTEAGDYSTILPGIPSDRADFAKMMVFPFAYRLIR